MGRSDTKDDDKRRKEDRSSSSRRRSSKDIGEDGDRRRHDDKHRDDRKKQRRDKDPDDSDRRSKHRKDHKVKKRRREDDGSEDFGEKRRRKHEKHHKSSRHGKRHKRDDRNDDRHQKDDSKTSTRHVTKPKKLKVDQSKLVSLGARLGHPPDTLLDAEKDYFAYHKHLWLYLYRDCSVAFDDLSSTQARAAFADFCQLYNSGALDSGYYAPTLPAAALEECQTTRHKWSLKISDQEDKRLHLLQEGIHKQTEYQAAVDTTMSQPPTVRQDDRGESIEQRGNDRQAERVANRRLRDHVQTVHEELAGGRTEGRERQIEKRHELSNKIHGASRDQRQEMELNDDALYGSGGGVDFTRALAASKQRSAADEARKQTRIAELQQNEVNRRNAMLESLGLGHKIGQKIEIQPRDDEPT